MKKFYKNNIFYCLQKAFPYIFRSVFLPIKTTISLGEGNDCHDYG